MDDRCTAKSKTTGERCGNRAINGTTKCRFHGGKSLKGADQPQYKHGRYSRYVREDLAKKIAVQAENADDVLSLVDELTMQRALIAEYLERFQQSGMRPTLVDISNLIDWLERVGKMVDRMVRQRNETALTAVEVQYLTARISELVVKYVPEDRQQAFVSELFSQLPATVAGNVHGDDDR